MPPLDDRLRIAMLDARASMLTKQTEAERAQVRFQHAVREAHAAGASLREIADVLDMSHQRVHQIVNPDSGKGAIRERPGATVLECTFCGRSQKQVPKLIAGPGVFICDACVEQSNLCIREGDAIESALTTIAPVEARKQVCSFCGKERRQVAAMVQARDETICSECLTLCTEIITEESGE